MYNRISIYDFLYTYFFLFVQCTHFVHLADFTKSTKNKKSSNIKKLNGSAGKIRTYKVLFNIHRELPILKKKEKYVIISIKTICKLCIYSTIAFITLYENIVNAHTMCPKL